MKLLAFSLVLAGAALSGGCQFFNTPAYSGQERFNQIGRNWTYEYEQLQDDVDHALLLRPASRLTVWNVYHRN